MSVSRIKGYPVLIIGAGRGGHALLEMFMEDTLVEVVAIADTNPAAPGLQLAKKFGITTYTDAAEALQACKQYPDCIIYNLSHDDSIADKAAAVFGNQRVASGAEVKLFWQMVTSLKHTKGELEKSQNLLQSVIRNVMDGIITADESGVIQGFNPAAERIFGYTQQEILGSNISMLMPEPIRGAHDGYIRRYLETGEAKLLGVSGREVTAVRKNGDTFAMEMSVSEMVLGGRKYFVGIVRDITERKMAENKIAHLAHHDYLTNLPNRMKFMTDLEQYARLAIRNKYRLAAIFLDLDGFKKVNDTLGHDMGDQLLQAVATRLTETLRSSDSIARIGGDEFIIILNNVGQHEDMAKTAEKIIGILSKPFDLNGENCRIGGSMGISVYPDDTDNLAKLVIQADAAMYQAKKAGKNTYRFYNEIAQ